MRNSGGMKLIFSGFWVARGARLAGSIVSCVALLSGNVRGDDGELSFILKSDEKSAKSESSEFALNRLLQLLS